MFDLALGIVRLSPSFDVPGALLRQLPAFVRPQTSSSPYGARMTGIRFAFTFRAEGSGAWVGLKKGKAHGYSPACVLSPGAGASRCLSPARGRPGRRGEADRRSAAGGQRAMVPGMVPAKVCPVLSL